MADIRTFSFSVTSPETVTSPMVIKLEIGLSDAFTKDATPRAWISVYDPGFESTASGFWLDFTYDEASNTFSAVKELSSNSTSGIYECSYIYANNALGQQIAYNKPYFQEQIFTTVLDVANEYADNNAPFVTNIEFQDPQFNALTEKWEISATFEASDTAGISELYASISYGRSGFSGAITNLGGDFYSIIFELSKFVPSGNYELDLRIFDKSLNGYWSINEEKTPSVNLENPYQDTTPPKLVAWTVTGGFEGDTPETSRPVFYITGQWQDDLSGTQSSFSVRSFYPNFDPNNQKFSDTSFQINENGEFFGKVYLANPSIDGTYSFDIVCVDNAGNVADLAGDTIINQYAVTPLSSLGFDGDIVVYAPPSTYDPSSGIQITSTSTDAIIFGGSGSDTLIGDNGNNQLLGGFGNDTLQSGDGDDVVDGGSGDDLIVGGNGAGNDTYIGGTGIDTIRYTSAIADITVNLLTGLATSTALNDAAGIGNDTLSGIENVISGNFNDTLTGDAANNDFWGMKGNDIIDGGMGTDRSFYSGVQANYTISALSNGSYRVTDNVGADGTDTLTNIELLVFSDRWLDILDNTAPTVLTFSPTDGLTDVAVGANIVLTFSEAIARGTGTITLRSTSASGTIVESFDAAANNRITVAGATLSIDPTSNLSANTQYFVVFTPGNIKDIVGNAYAGISTYDFRTVNIINGTANNDTLTGTVNADTINGLAGNDVITGGAGADSIDGGEGSDIFIIATTGDHAAAEFADTGTVGTDEVRFTSVTANSTLILYAGDTGIERVVVGTGTGATAITRGTTALNVDATALRYGITITGNAGPNILTGGSGNDTLVGGGGDDVINGSGGFDYADYSTSTTAITGNLSLGTVQVTGRPGSDRLSNIEGLIGGSGADALTGNAADNILIGGGGNDTISGGNGFDQLRGGAGNDKLTGGTGIDWFIFDTTPNAATNKDTITDFTSGIDKLQFSKAIFTGLSGATLGDLSAGAFWSGAGVTTAHDADDRFIYNTATGALYYDADGNASGNAAVLVAMLGSMTPLAYTDIQIFG